MRAADPPDNTQWFSLATSTTGIRLWYSCDNPAVRARLLRSTTLTLLALAPAGPAHTLVRTGRIRAGAATDVASGDLAVGIKAGAPALQAAGMTPAAR